MSDTEQRPELEILSPHYDDAAYSCWDKIDRLARVVTLFGGYPADEAPSDWDISTGFDNSRLAIEARIAENEAALRPTGAITLGLAFKDTVFRKEGELTAQDVFEELQETLDPEARILAPVGFSFSFQHPDHIMSREVAKLFMHDGRNVEFYADLPYSLMPDNLENWPDHLPIEEIKRLVDADVDIVPHRMSPEQAFAKNVAVRAYVSQFARNNDLSGKVFDDPRTFEWECIIHPV